MTGTGSFYWQNQMDDYPFSGKKKLKVLPFPNSLSTQILPSSLSTNSWQSISPKPVPGSERVPLE
jgi:hypothetical protein